MLSRQSYRSAGTCSKQWLANDFIPSSRSQKSLFAVIWTTYHSVLRDWYHTAAGRVAVPARETSWAGSAPSSRSAFLRRLASSRLSQSLSVNKIQWPLLHVFVGAVRVLALSCCWAVELNHL
jgi:hypothetical protein